MNNLAYLFFHQIVCLRSMLSELSATALCDKAELNMRPRDRVSLLGSSASPFFCLPRLLVIILN
jgi:hypothetical protein